MSDRVIDAIQGHASRTAGDGYGDVTMAAKLKVIDALPHYDLAIVNADVVSIAQDTQDVAAVIST